MTITAGGSNAENALDESPSNPTVGIAKTGSQEPDGSNAVPEPESKDPGSPPLSKNQQKKLLKQAEWEAKKPERKLIRKEKIAAKRERKKAERDQGLADEGPSPDSKMPRQQLDRSKTLPVTIMIDCDFDDLMRDNERKSLASQITRSYSENRKSPFRAQLAICSFGGKLQQRFDEILTHYKGWKNVRFIDGDFATAAAEARTWMADSDKETQLAGAFKALYPPDKCARASLQSSGEIVYLTAEASEDLTELKPYSTYIIGGLVDKNREKGLCHKRATGKGVRTARLPIGKYLEMQSRKVLATNHVVEIMLKWLQCGSWSESFSAIIPKRKGVKLKSDDRAEERPDVDTTADPLDSEGMPLEKRDEVDLRAEQHAECERNKASAVTTNGDTI